MVFELPRIVQFGTGSKPDSPAQATGTSSVDPPWSKVNRWSGASCSTLKFP